MNLSAHLAKRIFNRPFAILPDQAELLVQTLNDKTCFIKTPLDRRALILQADTMAFDFAGDAEVQKDPGYDVVEGVALISVDGLLINRFGYVRGWWGITGYDGIRNALLNAMDDPAVVAIVLNIDSCGGEVSGCFDLVDVIFQARAKKPIWAILDDCAYSAAYALASACSKIIVPRTGGVGSIGVVCMHVDYSEMLEKDGIAVTLIQFGARKTDSYPFKPLSAPAQARFQADIDAVGEIFVQTVARNRGISAASVKATEAGTFQGSLGVEAGLADAVMAPDAAFQSLLATL